MISQPTHRIIQTLAELSSLFVARLQHYFCFQFTNMEWVTGLEPALCGFAIRCLTIQRTPTYLAEDIRIELIHPFLNDGLANRCLNHSANLPYQNTLSLFMVGAHGEELAPR